MRKKFDKEKLLIIGILPLIWFAYFLFELFTGRIKSFFIISFRFSWMDNILYSKAIFRWN